MKYFAIEMTECLGLIVSTIIVLMITGILLGIYVVAPIENFLGV
jgi:hypothetical protein